jgi:hypothetical protein
VGRNTLIFFDDLPQIIRGDGGEEATDRFGHPLRVGPGRNKLHRDHPSEPLFSRWSPTPNDPPPKMNREHWASVFRFHELVGFGVFDAAFCSPSPVHSFVNLPNLLRSLALMCIQRSFLHVSNRSNVEKQIWIEADSLLIGHDLEEVKVPATFALIALPDKGTDDVMIRMGVERPVSDDKVGLDLSEPGSNLLQGRLISDQFIVSIWEELRFCAEHFAGDGCFLLANVGLGSSEETAITPEARAIGTNDFVALLGERSDEPTSPGFGIVWMPAEDNDSQLLAGVIVSIARHNKSWHDE